MLFVVKLSDPKLGQQREPSFDEVERGTVGRRVVDVEAWALREPSLNCGRLVGAGTIRIDDILPWATYRRWRTKEISNGGQRSLDFRRNLVVPGA